MKKNIQPLDYQHVGDEIIMCIMLGSQSLVLNTCQTSEIKQNDTRMNNPLAKAITGTTLISKLSRQSTMICLCKANSYVLWGKEWQHGMMALEWIICVPCGPSLQLWIYARFYLYTCCRGCKNVHRVQCPRLTNGRLNMWIIKDWVIQEKNLSFTPLTLKLSGELNDRHKTCPLL